MMNGRHDWTGTPEEMLAAISGFRDHTNATGWPSGTAALRQLCRSWNLYSPALAYTSPEPTMAACL